MPWFLNQLLDIRIGWLDDRHAAEHGELYPMPGGIDRTVDTSTVPTGLLRLSPSEQLQLRRQGSWILTIDQAPGYLDAVSSARVRQDFAR